ncbi:helix-turn-helix transcriptional regulator [Bacillus sp. ISL-47]|uniref:response regulator transcription factor n=1 Tax=Bacillus sp. ISL-47 TaxID=2819130 RepID=UPI001BEBCAC6|nr:helix-turn-helix transcriptional regulator [Bacillus sp. ISL-47]MBT2689380.1 helix-turn-helix transcriptional regulator [Bacillus sp. ISL-47]MBT2709897.1 helix-turn-helix transcriptional regulator [Pseudomonas sp. ISL-84]
MTIDPTFLDNIQILEEVDTHEEKLYKILEVYMNTFPVKNAYLFRYSPLGFIGEGIIAITSIGLMHIRDIRDDIRSLPLIYSALYERKAKYCSGLEYLKQINIKYITTSNVNSFLATPICFGSVAIGYICTNEFDDGVNITDQLVASFTKYGRQVGKILEKTNGPEDPQLLSRREMEVMKRISWGESIKEMADSMFISEVTINQYIKTAIKKLGAQNRTQAIAEMFRRGIIS